MEPGDSATIQPSNSISLPQRSRDGSRKAFSDGMTKTLPAELLLKVNFSFRKRTEGALRAWQLFSLGMEVLR